MRAAPAYSKPTAAAQGSAARGRGPGRGVPARSRPPTRRSSTVCSLMVEATRARRPPPKENRRGDDVFMAQAELRALEALNAKLQEDLIKLEELNQTLEIEKSEAVSPNRPRRRRCGGSSSRSRREARLREG